MWVVLAPLAAIVIYLAMKSQPPVSGPPPVMTNGEPVPEGHQLPGQRLGRPTVVPRGGGTKILSPAMSGGSPSIHRQYNDFQNRGSLAGNATWLYAVDKRRGQKISHLSKAAMFQRNKRDACANDKNGS